TVSHGLYNNLRHFAADRFAGAQTTTFLGKAFSRFMEREDQTEFSWTDKLGFLAQGIATEQIFELAKPANASLWRQFSNAFSQSSVKARLAGETKGGAGTERRGVFLVTFL